MVVPRGRETGRDKTPNRTVPKDDALVEFAVVLQKRILLLGVVEARAVHFLHLRCWQPALYHRAEEQNHLALQAQTQHGNQDGVDHNRQPSRLCNQAGACVCVWMRKCKKRSQRRPYTFRNRKLRSMAKRTEKQGVLSHACMHEWYDALPSLNTKQYPQRHLSLLLLALQNHDYTCILRSRPQSLTS